MKKRDEDPLMALEPYDSEEQFERNRAPVEARTRATRGAFPKPRPFRLGCALVLIALTCSSVTFAIAIVAAMCAHRWGLS